MMRDNFVGDWGDFGKYSLLRALTGLCSEQSSEDRLSLGVVWYVPDGKTIARTRPGHGQDLGYLFDERMQEELSSCDEALLDVLKDLACHQRTLCAVGRRGIIGPGDRFHHHSIPCPDDRDEREVERTRWLQAALAHVRGPLDRRA